MSVKILVASLVDSMKGLVVKMCFWLFWLDFPPEVGQSTQNSGFSNMSLYFWGRTYKRIIIETYTSVGSNRSCWYVDRHFNIFGQIRHKKLAEFGQRTKNYNFQNMNIYGIFNTACRMGQEKGRRLKYGKILTQSLKHTIFS